MTKFEIAVTCILTAITIVMTSLVIVSGETAKRVEKMSNYFGLEQVVTDSVSIDYYDEFDVIDTSDELMEH